MRRGRPERGGLGILLCYRDARGRVQMPVLEPLMGPPVLSGREYFPSRLGRGSPWLRERFSGFACFPSLVRGFLLGLALPGTRFFYFRARRIFVWRVTDFAGFGA